MQITRLPAQLPRVGAVALGLSACLLGCQRADQPTDQPTVSTLQVSPAAGSSLTVTPATGTPATGTSAIGTSAAANQMSNSGAANSEVTNPGGVAPSQVASADAATGGSTLQVQAAQGSYLTEKPATASDAQIQQALTELDARQNSQGDITIALPGDVLFDFDRATIRPDARVALAKIDRLLVYYSKSPVEIAGHTDSIGGDAYNQTLSEQRAAAVRDYLVNQFQIANSRLQAQGFGKTRPVASNTKPDGSDNPQGRQLNRRVEVKIQSAT